MNEYFDKDDVRFFKITVITVIIAAAFVFFTL
jgi:hypothetical protein